MPFPPFFECMSDFLIKATAKHFFMSHIISFAQPTMSVAWFAKLIFFWHYITNNSLVDFFWLVVREKVSHLMIHSVTTEFPPFFVKWDVSLSP